MLAIFGAIALVLGLALPYAPAPVFLEYVHIPDTTGRETATGVVLAVQPPPPKSFRPPALLVRLDDGRVITVQSLVPQLPVAGSRMTLARIGHAREPASQEDTSNSPVK